MTEEQKRVWYAAAEADLTLSRYLIENVGEESRLGYCLQKPLVTSTKIVAVVESLDGVVKEISKYVEERND